MAKIRLRYEANCADCGAFLPVGSLVRYYGRNGIYGVHCHTKSESTQAANSAFRAKKQREAERARDAEYAAACYGDSQER